jgi:hypothetical protein
VACDKNIIDAGSEGFENGSHHWLPAVVDMLPKAVVHPSL